LHAIRSDLEANTAEEDILDLHIYSTLALLKLRQPQVDIEKVKVLIKEMENTIKDPVVRDLGPTNHSRTEMSADLDRVKWKAIYLSGLLYKLLPPDEREGRIETLRERVRTLSRSGELLLVDDHERCIKPLDMGALELGTPAKWWGPKCAVFEKWIDDFPLFPLAGSVSYKIQW
jgi:hypothetical protein